MGNGAATPTTPPIVVFLPGKGTSARNTASRVAELIAIKATKGPGTFAAEDLPDPSPRLVDGRRIVRAGAGPVLDVAMLDYRPLLERPKAAGAGIGPSLRRLGSSIVYLARGATLVLGASGRAKSRVARLQLAVGVAGVAALAVSVVFTSMAVLASLGLWSEPVVAGNAADAVALGATAFTSWVFWRVRPAMRDAASGLEQLLDYAYDQRHAAGVVGALASAIDDLLEADPDREIHVLGYSLGSLIAVDFLYPRESMREVLDLRHASNIASLVTVGCPVDFVRLYLPAYLEGRVARVPKLRWTNVFIAADVLGSNFIEGDDFTDVATGAKRELRLADEERTSYRYTDERLTVWNVWGRRGFLSHGGYWDEPERENCLHLAMSLFLPAPAPVAPPQPAPSRSGGS